ncbi:3383_t:CDS:2 [Funneliformis geosporum]|uniref:3383_t:CDS:1 n=1 Tax=Funneliformis geosporum TaxID=1117311 RepID=A0A9W4WNR1_9GLOM|nr:3383_t:CDS:2 [Funneliformis geosporum]
MLPIKVPIETSKFIINYKCEIQTNQDLFDISLKNLCLTDAKQPCNELENAEFASTIELLDDNDMIREYPTALIKQFDCDQHYEFCDVEIHFRMIVLKEFINALGVKTKIQSINETAKSIDEFVKEPNVKFKDQEEFIAKFVKSPQIESAQRIANVSVNLFTLGFQLRGSKSDDDVNILETSLNPYQNGVSMNNFNASIYANTKNFLMVSTLTNGKTLEDFMGKFLSLFGLKLISLLETLG